MRYERYRLNGKELLISALLYIFLDALVSFLFYDSIISFILLGFGMPVFMVNKSKELGAKRISLLRLQFVDMICSLEASLMAGLSVENAIREVLDDMEKLHGTDSYIAMELREIIRREKVGITVTEGLLDFAQRSGIVDIKDFSIVFTEAVKSGGNLKEVIQNTVKIIQEKVRIEEEIEAMLKGKMLEQKVMSIIPFLIIGYLRISSGDFIGVLYHNLAGVVVMSICLVVYVTAYFMALKIVKIEI